jgi:Fic-DOC domain mobile mystery protein B
MFGRTWRWAGKFRRTLKNIGVPPETIATELEKLLAVLSYWVEHGTYDPDEIAIRFHHRLVAIHPFSNGNGRHAREMTDRLLVHLGRPRLTWGAATLHAPGEARARYLEALRAADGGEYQPLRDFVRT